MPSTSPCFLDACVPIYAAGREHHYKESCSRIVSAIGAGRLEAVTDVEVVQEIAYRFHALRRPEGMDVAGGFLALMETVLPVTRSEIAQSLELQREYPSLGPRDAIHVAVMLEAGVRTIVTADRHFDQVREVERVDPAELRW